MKPLIFNLDIQEDSYESCDLMQGYDYNMQFNITDGYTALDLTGISIQIHLVKADYKFIIQTEKITVANNVINVAIDKDLTRESGKGKLQVVLSKDNRTFGTWVVKCNIKESAINDNDGQSENKVTITEELANKVTEAVKVKEDTEKLIVEGGAATTGDVIKINAQLEEKANKEDVAKISSGTPLFASSVSGMTDIARNYVNKTDGYLYTYNGTSFVSSGVKYQSTGLSDKSATSTVKTALGEFALITSTGGTINFDKVNKRITIPASCIIVERKNRYTLGTATTIDLSVPLSAPTTAYVYFDTAGQTFQVRDGSSLSNITEDCVLCAIVPPTGNPIINATYTINGLFYGELSTYPSYKRTNLGEMGFVSSSRGNIDIDTINKKITIGDVGIIATRNKFYTNNGGWVIDLSPIMNLGTASYVFFDTNSQTFVVSANSTLTNITETSILVAVVPALGLGTPYINGVYTINGVSAFYQNDSYYVPTSIPSQDGTITGAFNAETLTSNDMYVAYDSLVAKYPKYIKKTLLGKDATGVLPIYRYDFIPEFAIAKDSISNTVVDETGSAPIKIIIGTGIHGNGVGGDNTDSIIATYYFLKDICERNMKSNILGYMRRNVHFIVIPVQNPYGVDNNSRYNGNNVDVNRNFDYFWNETASNQSKGDYPFSEPEAQFIKTVLETNTDALAYFDIHTRGGDTYNQSFPTLLASISYNSIMMKISQKTMGLVLSNYSTVTNLENRANMFKEMPTAFLYAQKVLGIESSNIECAYFAKPSGDSKHSALVSTINISMVGNSIWDVIQYFINNPKNTAYGITTDVVIGDKTLKIKNGVIIDLLKN